MVGLPRSGWVNLTCDVADTQVVYYRDLVPLGDRSRAETIASIGRVKGPVSHYRARVVVQHAADVLVLMGRSPSLSQLSVMRAGDRVTGGVVQLWLQSAGHSCWPSAGALPRPSRRLRRFEQTSASWKRCSGSRKNSEFRTSRMSPLLLQSDGRT